MNVLLWLAYLSADRVAAFAIGLISHNQSNSSARGAEVDGALQAFWASFLLLHLGGTDTITSFSMEDNSLWGRHLLSLTFQIGAAIYVFMQIFTVNKLLVIPTMLVFLAAVIKNAERISALNLSSLPRLGEWVFSHDTFSEDAYNELVQELDVLGEDGEEGEQEEVKLLESTVVKHGYNFFQIFKVFLGDLMFTCQEREMSRKYFHYVSAVDALRVISVELHFIYEVLHTKALAIRSKWSFILRFMAFTDLNMAFVLFYRLKKHRLHKLDVEITYFLLFGGIALDLIALFMLIFSDWIVARINSAFFQALDCLMKPHFANCTSELYVRGTYKAFNTRLIFKRWSESIFACNLLSESFGESPRKMYKLSWHGRIFGFSDVCWFPLCVTARIISCFQQASEIIVRVFGSRNTRSKISTLANSRHVSKNPFIKELWIFIFKEVKRKSENADDSTKVREIFEARGDLCLQNTLPRSISSKFLQYVTRANYDTSVIVWHVATEIWYNIETPEEWDEEWEFSKILSDYVTYLLLNRLKVISAVTGIAQITTWETVRELREHIRSHRTKDVKELCTQLYQVRFGQSSQSIHSQSPLRQGIKLAQEIESLGEIKWKVMSGVWVEMLSYAASHVKGEAHVQVLSEGGELLAFVWLLMAHFGCLYRHEWGMYYEYQMRGLAV
ncbi:uncharacterized protein LOC125316180 [Rhodamnia argentea]|uniref:Uncharacterized protein LOC125316180 n=1 Tax=Rhodamnia argentea TaxID=178133 RepID=A0ABM3HSS5_9MYRT|nr:uncharacterized protein LOC125316180 [Rhodamnia argentea]